MNAIGVLRIETSRPIYFDAYAENRTTGSFILIDADSNATVAAGMILGAVAAARARTAVISKRHDRVTPAERMARYGHSAADGIAGTQDATGVAAGAQIVRSRLRGDDSPEDDAAGRERLRFAGAAGVAIKNRTGRLPEDDAQAAEQIIATLEDAGVLLPEERLTGGEGI